MEFISKVLAGGVNVGVMSTEGPLEVLEELVELLSTGCTGVYFAARAPRFKSDSTISHCGTQLF